MDERTSQTKDRAGVKVPPPVLFIGLLVAGLLARYFSGCGFAVDTRSIFFALALALFLVSSCMAVSAIVLMKRAGTHIHPHQPTLAIVERGPYRFTRNPMYSALVFLMLALAALFRCPWLAGGAVLLWFLLDRLVVRQEEVYLERKFGETYTRYTSRVRRWL